MSVWTNRLRPSQSATIYSLVDEEPYVGMPPIKPVTPPVRLYARDSAITEAPVVSLVLHLTVEYVV